MAHAFDVTATPTVTAGAYSAGDIVGGLLTFPVSFMKDMKVIVTGVQVASKAAVAPTWSLILLNSSSLSTTTTDNAAYSLNTADTFKVVKALTGLTIFDHGTPNTWALENLALVAAPAIGEINLYGLLLDGTGVTLSSTSDIQVRLRGVGV